ncbi:MAG TPA: PAS domain-containing protein, partial [Planctomycetia bacterium]|nr:PAS domain-containing protein [Planctomycetia bacterium]
MDHPAPTSDVDAEMARLRDLVARLETEVAAQRHVRRVLESLPQKLFYKDLESRFVYCNEGFARHFGLSPEEMIGKTDFDVCPQDLAVKYRADDQRVMHSRQPVTLIEPNDVGQTRRFVEVTKAPVFDDDRQVVGLVGIFTDVTGRVRAESQLRQSRQQLQAILDNSPAIVTIKDAAGRYVLVNRRFSETFGVEVRDVVGRTDHEIIPAA